MSQTHRVTICHITVDRALAFKRDLLDAGLIMGVDFEWYYHRARYDAWSGDAGEPDMVHFDLQDPVLATFYRLKWSKDN